MKIAIPILILVIAIVVIALVASANKQIAEKQNAVNRITSKGVIKIGLRGDIGALCTYDPEREVYEGLEKDILDEILSRLFKQEILVEYVDVNSETKDAMLKVGDIDISLGASIWKDTSNIIYTNSYYSDGSAFLVRQGLMTSQAGLKGQTVAVVQGSFAAAENEDDEELINLQAYLESQKIDADVKVYASYPEAIEALDTGFVSGVCANEIFLKFFGKKGMLILPERFLPNNFRVAVSESLGIFRDVIDDILLEMKKDGTTEAFIEKWNLVDYAGLEE